MKTNHSRTKAYSWQTSSPKSPSPTLLTLAPIQQVPIKACAVGTLYVTQPNGTVVQTLSIRMVLNDNSH